MKSKNMKTKKILIYCICSALIGAIVLIPARFSDGFAEWYASNIFPVFPATIGRVMSIFPFSVFEILIYLLIITFVIHTIYFLAIVVVPKWRFNVKRAAIRASCVALTIVCTMFMMFSLTAGVNYSRETFADLTGRRLTLSSPEDLLTLSELLVRELSELSERIPTDEQGLFTIRYIDVNEETREAMRRLGRQIPELAGFYPNAKPIFASRWMSRLNVTGIYSPFTVEANFNTDVPDYLIPFTIRHEFAHLKGFMREDEANFIAYLAGRDSDSIELRYSAAMVALSHVLSAYYRAVGSEQFAELRNTFPEQVIRDFAANNQYWAQFRGRAAQIATRANDVYLRANAQQDGVQSYGRMVDLLLAEYRIGAHMI